jgi:hypothetical protein
MRPFSGAAGSKQAPTDALRLVGAISLTAVVGGPHPHQTFDWILDWMNEASSAFAWDDR